MVRGRFGRPAIAPAKFKAGDRCACQETSTPPHIRACPRLCAGGISAWIERDHGCQVFSRQRRRWDAGENPQMALHGWCLKQRSYGARTLTRTVKVSIDAFEPYLEQALMDPGRDPQRDHCCARAFPSDADGPVFRAPWEAQAFRDGRWRCMRGGLFTWSEWAGNACR